jgi:hypothetical protein
MSSYSEWVPNESKPFDTHNLFLQSIDTCFLYIENNSVIKIPWIFCFISLIFPFRPTWSWNHDFNAAHNQHELPKIPEVFFSNYSQLFYIYTKNKSSQ